MYLAETPFIGFASLWYCMTQFTPFCSVKLICSFQCKSWLTMTPRNLCTVMAGTSTPPREMVNLGMGLVHGLPHGFNSLFLVNPITLNLSRAKLQWYVLNQSNPPWGCVIMLASFVFASSSVLACARMS